MPFDQLIIFAILFFTLALFIFGRWRYEIVALIALLAAGFSGILPASSLFLGFGHPAVITVAAVLVMSRAIQNSGLVNLAARWLQKAGNNETLQVALMMALVTAISSFMNEIGALAAVMPIAVQMARKSQRSPSYLLMPLAFGSLLGGMLTLIGTPPNIIVGTFRATTIKAAPFGMFDFTLVGSAVALAGVLGIIFFGRRLIPKGQGVYDGLFQIREYTSEVAVPEKSKLVGKPLSQVELMGGGDVAIIGLIRGSEKLLAPSGFETLWANDILIVEASPAALKAFVDAAQMVLANGNEEIEELIKSEEVAVVEAAITPHSPIIGKNARSLHMRWRYGVNLLAVARQGQRLQERLGGIRLKPGDVLLLQGPAELLPEILSTLGCLPLSKRDLHIGQPRRILLCLAIFGAGLLATLLGLLPVQIAFTASALGMLLTGMLSLREVYDSIEWPLIILLGAMIPLGEALEATGGAALIANQMISLTGSLHLHAAVGLLLLLALLLSNLMNNAAVAVLMAPIAMNMANGMGVSPDPFLMTVAVGCSSPFLAPINNALVMGYQFRDYWKMGFMLTVIAMAVCIPLVLWVWLP